MPTTESSLFFSPSVREAVSTGAATEARITRDYGQRDETLRKWRAVIEDRLIEWGKDPGQLEDEDIRPPSKDTIRLAIELADVLSSADYPPPTRVVPDADAGIVFELVHGSLFESLRISADGSTEYCAFEKARLVARRDFRLSRGE
jgi:hypothetical protein